MTLHEAIKVLKMYQYGIPCEVDPHSFDLNDETVDTLLRELDKPLGEMMVFPESVDEFIEQYKITDTEQIYTNGADLIPAFRMKQWCEHAMEEQHED